MPEESPPPHPPAALEAAAQAAGAHSWARAVQLYAGLPQGAFTAPDLELLADSQWWTCRLDESMATRRLAYKAYAASGNHARSAYNAWFLAYDHFSKGEASMGAGWLERAARHLLDHPLCREHAYIEIASAHEAEGAGEWSRAAEHARRVQEIGERFEDRDLVILGLQTLGRDLIGAGEVRRGLKLLDEAMTSVVGGEVGAFVTGWVYCNVLIACLDLGEVGRAAEWSESASAWCESLGESTPYNGLCRVYRVGVLTLRGRLAEAERDAERAGDELAAFVSSASGAAWYELGEIRRRQGNLEEAERAFEQAHSLGADPQPGLALVRLQQGRVDAAQRGLKTSLGLKTSPLSRSRLLAAQVQVALARRDIGTARDAADELQTLARNFGSSFLKAHHAWAEGAIALVSGDALASLDHLEIARRGFQELRLPYEVAVTRVLAAEAAGRVGDQDRAEMERAAGRDLFREVGSVIDPVNLIRPLIGARRLPGGLSPREAEVLRRVAAGKTNREIGRDLVISEHTVARHLTNILTKLGVPSRAAAAAYAMESGIVASMGDSQN